MLNLEKYLEWLTLNYTNSPQTVKKYYETIRDFSYFSKNEINQELINSFFLEKIKEGCKNSTLNSIKYCFSTYFKFSKESFELPKQQKINKTDGKEYITYEYLQSDIISHLTLLFPDYKLYTNLIIFMFFTGLRPDEVSKLLIADVDFKKQEIMVKETKGRADRRIPFLNTTFFKEFETFIPLHQSKTKSNTVFGLTYKQIKYAFDKIKVELNLKTFTPKILRVSFGKYCIKKGLDISKVKILLGHKDIKTTEIYIEPTYNEIKDACNKIKME